MSFEPSLLFSHSHPSVPVKTDVRSCHSSTYNTLITSHFSFRIKAKVLSMARKILRYQDFCSLSVRFLLPYSLFQPHWPPCRSLSVPECSWLLHMLSHCLDCFASGDPCTFSPSVICFNTLVFSLALSIPFDIAYFPLPLGTLLLDPGFCILLELFVPVGPLIYDLFHGLLFLCLPLNCQVSISSPL